MANTTNVLSLYKQLIKTANRLELARRPDALAKIRLDFKSHKGETNESQIKSYIEGIVILVVVFSDIILGQLLMCTSKKQKRT